MCNVSRCALVFVLMLFFVLLMLLLLWLVAVVVVVLNQITPLSGGGGVNNIYGPKLSHNPLPIRAREAGVARPGGSGSLARRWGGIIFFLHVVSVLEVSFAPCMRVKV